MRISTIAILIFMVVSCMGNGNLESAEFVRFFKTKANGYELEGTTNGLSYKAELRPRSLIALYDLGDKYYDLNQNQLDSFIQGYANEFEVLVTANIDTNTIKLNLNDAGQLLNLQTELEQQSQFEAAGLRNPVGSCTIIPMGRSLQVLFGSGEANHIGENKPSLIISSKVLGIPGQRISFSEIKVAPHLKSAL